MSINTMLLTFWLASGAIQQTPTTYDECRRDLHVVTRWARVIEITRRGRLVFGDDAVVATDCLPINLTPCDVEES